MTESGVSQVDFDVMLVGGEAAEKTATKIKLWINSDDNAKEIRNIVKRVIVEYSRFIKQGSDVGITTTEDRRLYLNKVRLALHDLEEFGVTRDMHVRTKPEEPEEPEELEEYYTQLKMVAEEFYTQPNMVAEWIGGDFLKFLDFYGLSDIELDKEILDLDEKNKLELDDDTDTVLIEGKSRELMMDPIQIWSAISHAKRYLGITDKEIAIDDAMTLD